MKKELFTHISTGQYRGRRVRLPALGRDKSNAALRPTKQQVVLAGLDMLGSRVAWPAVRVLDACCGSGQWGLEALSRGAAAVVLADVDTALVRENMLSLPEATARARVVTGDIRHLTVDAPFDVIFFDPPYEESKLYEAVFSPLAPTRGRAAWGKEGSFWLVEADAAFTPAWPAWLQLVKERKFGGTRLFLLEQSDEKRI